MKKRLLAGALSVALFASTSPISAMAFDDTNDHWSAEYVNFCTELGLINGVSESQFSPDENLTVAQGVAIAARFHTYMTDSVELKEIDPWYAVYVGYFEDLGQEIPENLERNITREEFFELLAMVMPEKNLEPINDIDEIPDTDDEKILAFYNAGILTGSDDYGNFNGNTSLTRAESATIMARCADENLRIEFTIDEVEDSIAGEYLFMNDDDAALTINGFEVSAEAYMAVLNTELEKIEAEHQLEFYPELQEQYNAWLKSDFRFGFERYLSEIHGINDYNPIIWTQKDEETGVFPYEVASENVYGYLTYHAAVRSLCEDYGLSLSDDEKTQIEEVIKSLDIKDEIRKSYTKITLDDEYLYSLLVEEVKPTAPKIDSMIATKDYVCADFISFDKTDLSEAELTVLREGMSALHAELNALPVYANFVETAANLEVTYSGMRPTIYSEDSIGEGLFNTLAALKPAGVSAVMETDESIKMYFVMLGLDHEMTEIVRENHANDLVQEQMAMFLANVEIENSSAVNNLNVLDFAREIM